MNPISELSSFFYSIQQNPLAPDALTSRVSLVAASLLSLANEEESPRIQTLIGRVSEAPDAISSLQSFFMEKVTGLQPFWKNAEQKAEAPRYLLPCLNLIKNDVHVPILLHAFSHLSPEWMPDFQNLMCSLLNSGREESLEFMSSLYLDLPSSRWKLATSLCSETEDADLKISYLAILRILHTIDNAELENGIIEQLAAFDLNCKRPILQALQFLPHDQILPAMAYWHTLNRELHQYPYLLINRWISSDLSQKEPLHAFLRKELQTTRNGSWAYELSGTLMGFPMQFHLQETDSLYGEAEEIALLTQNLNSPTNPYTLYRNLTNFSRKEPAFSLTLHSELTPMGLWRLNAHQIASVHLDPIRRSALPQDVNRATYEALWNDLNLRITNLDPTEKKATRRHIREMTNARFSYLREDSLSNEYLRSLFELPEKQEDPVSVETAYFFAILKKILDTSNEREEDALLSPQEEMLVKVACGIQNCPTGRAEGISSTYLMLIPLESQYQNCQAVGLSSQVKAWQFIWLTAHKLILEKLSNPGPLMEAFSGEKDPRQIAHYALFLKNAIGFYLGISQTVEFDRYSGVLPMELVRKTPEELLRIFYQYASTPEFTIALQKAFHDLSLEQKQQIAHSATELLAANPSLPQELIEGEDPEENLIHITYNEECTEVMDMTLSYKGAVYLLYAAGVIDNALSDSFFPLLVGVLSHFLESPQKAAYWFQKLPPETQKQLFDRTASLSEIAPISSVPKFEDLNQPYVLYNMHKALYELALSEVINLARKEILPIHLSIPVLHNSVQMLIYTLAKKYCLDHQISEEPSGQHAFYTKFHPSQQIEVIEQAKANLENLFLLANWKDIDEELLLVYLELSREMTTTADKAILGSIIPFATGLSKPQILSLHPLFQKNQPSSIIELNSLFTLLLTHIKLPAKLSFIKTILSLPIEERLSTLQSLSCFCRITNINPSCYLDILQTLAQMPATSRVDAVRLSFEMIVSESEKTETTALTTDLPQSLPHIIILCIQNLNAEYLPHLIKYLPPLFQQAEQKASLLAKILTLETIQHIPPEEIPSILTAIAFCLPTISPTIFPACIEKLASVSQEERSEIMQAFSLLLSSDVKQSDLFDALFSLPKEHRSDIAAKAKGLISSTSGDVLKEILQVLIPITSEEREDIATIATPWIAFYPPEERVIFLSNLSRIPRENRKDVVSLMMELFPPQGSALCRMALDAITHTAPENQIPTLRIVQRVLNDMSLTDRLAFLCSISPLSAEEKTQVWNTCHTACPENALRCVLALLTIPSSQRASVSSLLLEPNIAPDEKMELLHFLKEMLEPEISIFCNQLQQHCCRPGMVGWIVRDLKSLDPKERINHLLRLLHPSSQPQKRKYSDA